YGELDGAASDLQTYALTLGGPFGENTLSGLARRTTELHQEVTDRVQQAREQFAARAAELGLPWEKELRAGAIREHVPFAASQERLDAIEQAGSLIADERREYWATLRAQGLIARLVISAGEASLRVVALCPLAQGELYEVVSEVDHASYVFASAEPVVRAWTEVGFRREPIFTDEGEFGPLRALQAVVASLRQARSGLVKRIVHASVEGWRRELG
ncbi:MAG TPA: hypothetical protein VM283_04415, partial [Armatimonadota bacterium]|nr:hypothetical protein [Armatimonadota bacterium]